MLKEHERHRTPTPGQEQRQTPRTILDILLAAFEWRRLIEGRRKPRDRLALLAAVLACATLLAGCISGAATGEDRPSMSSEVPDRDDGAPKRDSVDGSIAAGADQAKPGGGARVVGPKGDSATADAGGAAREQDNVVDAGAEISAEPGMTAPVVAAGLPCDVQAIVQARCGTCHGDPALFGAPMPLTSHSQFHRAATTNGSKQVHQAVEARINATSKQMPPAGSTPLAPDELATLNAWLDQGAPESAETCSDLAPPDRTDSGGSSADVAGLDCYKFVAHAQGDKKAKFPVGVAVDVWMDMTFQAEWQGEAYLQVIRPVVDNAAVIHHWALYVQPGTDGDVQPGTGVHTGGERVAGWGPGGPNTDFREFGDVGLPLPSTTYVLDIHYNSSDPNAQDASGAELCMSRTQPKILLGNTRLGYINSFVAGDFEGPRTTWTGVCRPVSQEPIHILYVVPHMHRTGRHMRSIISDRDGNMRTLLDTPYDFEYQNGYKEDVILMPGESITTTCTYSEPKEFGQGTNDEMCFLFTYSYPRGALVDDTLLGAILGAGESCLGQ